MPKLLRAPKFASASNIGLVVRRAESDGSYDYREPTEGGVLGKVAVFGHCLGVCWHLAPLPPVLYVRQAAYAYLSLAARCLVPRCT
jgi:hypothetical protein